MVTASDSGTADGVSQTVTSEASDTLTATATVRWNYFLSYSTKDEVFAKWIVALLQQNGRSVFAQFKDIKQGNNFVREMQKGLARSNQLIALLSPDYEKSDHCQAEWAAAYRLDPSGNARKILPFMIRPTTPNELAGPFVYVPLVGLSEQDASSAVLNALGLGNHREMPTVEWPGSEMMRPLIEATGGIYGVEPDGELRLNLRPPRISDEKTSNLTSAQLYSSAAETIQRFAAHCRSSPGNRRCSERMLRRAGELDEVAAKPLETCNALALNDCLVWVLRVIVLDQMDGVIPPNDELGFHASDLLGLYNRLPSIFPQLKDYRALKVGERFIPPDADAAKAIEAIKDRFGEESLQSQVFAAVLARDLETSVANALEASSESALRNDVASRNQEVESHKGAAARIMSVWDWLANARQKFVRSGKNAAEVTEAIENYEKLYGKLAPSMLKLIEYLMKWLT